MRAVALALLLLSFCLSYVHSAKLTVHVMSDGQYSVELGGVEWFSSEATFVTIQGNRISTKNGQLKLESVMSTVGSDALGTFNRTLLQYSAAGTGVTFSVRQYDEGSTLVFEQSFPKGLEVRQFDSQTDRNTVSTAFPAFRPSNLADKTRRGFMAYDGWSPRSPPSAPTHAVLPTQGLRWQARRLSQAERGASRPPRT